MVNGRDAARRRPDSAAHCPCLPLLGDHQQLNAALALATVEVLQDKIPVSDAAVRNGLQNVNWPGRLQLVRRPSGQKILLDGAHNVAGAKVLCQALEKYFGRTRRILVLGSAFGTRIGGRFAKRLRRWRCEFTPFRFPANVLLTRANWRPPAARRIQQLRLSSVILCARRWKKLRAMISWSSPARFTWWARRWNPTGFHRPPATSAH